ncbi:MAG: translation initiation factor IF-2 [Kiritimatiellia bacterium]
MRVYELAKELGVTAESLQDRMRALGGAGGTRFSEVAPEIVAQLCVAPAAPLVKTVAAPAPKPAPAIPTRTPASARPPVHKAAPAATPRPPPAPSTPLVTPAANVPVVKDEPPASDGTEAVPSALTDKTISLKGPVIVRELAIMLGVRPNQLIAELMRLNVLASINECIEIKDAARVAEKHGFVIEKEKKREHKPLPPKKEKAVLKEQSDVEEFQPRPPIATILGHVDHGKTSLLDYIRKTAVTKGESGGITQHIGAYTAYVNGKIITFLDTPGHEAFTAMRSRGAQLTDIPIIVVAADDGLMPQTREAIKHAEAAKVPIMVAINKIDLPGANVEKVKQQLAGIGLSPEDWGGTTIICPVSAITGEGVDHLLEMILLQAEVLELKAKPGANAQGYVVEAQLEPGMGPTATVLVKNGTLHIGDNILVGACCGRVRALMDDHGKRIKSAGPSMPVKVLGLNGVPEVGAEFSVCKTDREARERAAERAEADKLAQFRAPPQRASLETLFQKLKDSEQIGLNLVLKTDVQGSAEAIEHALLEIKSQKVKLNILLSGVGTITSNDVLLCSASDGIVLGFHVGVDETAARLSKKEGVEIRLHSIIYELLDQVREVMAGMLPPIIKEKLLGHALVKQVFEITKSGVVAGCSITDGLVTTRLHIRVKREDAVLYEGTINSLRHFQNEVSEVREGQECGIRLDNFTDFKSGDKFEFYEVEKIVQTL